MTREQNDRVRAERHILAVCPTADDLWLSERGSEPSLDELFEDPIMRLLWRADGLEPARARATLLGLQDLVRRASRARPEHAGGVVSRSRHSIAA